jgi:hypothetical protein
MGVKIKGIGIKQADLPSGMYWTIKVPQTNAGDPVLNEDGKQVMTDRAVTSVQFDEDGNAEVPNKKIAEALVEAFPQNIRLA